MKSVLVLMLHGLAPKWLHFGFDFLKVGRPALPGQARFRSFTLSRRTNVLLLERVLLSPMGHFPHIHSPQGKDHGVPIGKRGERERGRGQTNARRQHAGGGSAAAAGEGTRGGHAKECEAARGGEGMRGGTRKTHENILCRESGEVESR